MAKAPAQPRASISKPTSAPPTKKRAAVSEIDDIFSKKPKPPSVATPLPTVAAEGSLNKKKKSKGKGKETARPDGEENKSGGVKAKRVPETIVDSSAAIDSYRPASVPVVKKRKAGGDGAEADKVEEEDDRFMDSRGTNSELASAEAGGGL
jgi:hypothetical protein